MFTTLLRLAQLNNGVTWLRGKHSVLALAAHDLLVLLCFVRPHEKQMRTQQFQGQCLLPSPVSLALKPKQTQPALPASDISMEAYNTTFPPIIIIIYKTHKNRQFRELRNDFPVQWGINWQGIMVSWDGWCLVRIPWGCSGKKARRNGGRDGVSGKSDKASFQKAVDLRNPGQPRRLSVRNCESVWKDSALDFSEKFCQWKSSVTRHQLSSTDCAISDHTVSPQFPDFDTEFTLLAPLHSGISAVLPFLLLLPCRTEFS